MNKIIVDSFEKYVEASSRLTQPHDLFELFIKTMKQFGYDQILFGLATDHKEISMKAGIGIMQNYPASWMKHYHANSLERIDPIVTFGSHQDQAFVWNEISKHVRLQRKQIRFLHESDEAGLHNGLTVPLHGDFGEIAGVSLTTTEKHDACRFNPDLLTAYCNHFYLTYRKLHTKRKLNPKNLVLTRLERDVLQYLGLGLTENQIADKLRVSKHTVNKYLRILYSKLETNNRTVAVVKAISMGLISY